MSEQNNFGQVDLAYLREISGNDTGFIIEMLDVFLEQTPQLIDELGHAIKSAEYQKIIAVAHKVKPTFSMLGKDDIKDELHKIESLAKSESTISSISLLYDQIFESLPSLYDDIELAKANL